MECIFIVKLCVIYFMRKVIRNVFSIEKSFVMYFMEEIFRNIFYSEIIANYEEVREVFGEVYVYINIFVNLVYANCTEYLGSIPGHVIPKTLKTVHDASLLNTQQYKVHIEGKVEQSRERSSALPYTSV